MEQQTTNAILIEMDDKSWDSFLDSAAKWFDNLLLMQSSYRNYWETQQIK